MSDGLRVLLVEDLFTDAELIEREIKKGFPASTFLRVETRDAFLNAIADFVPGIIICDYKLPRFNGMEALQLARDRIPGTPFIIVTGSLNEDTAVACMKAGAWDYVIKEHLKRLGPALESAIQQQQIRLDGEEARKKSNRWERLFATARFGLAHTDVSSNTFIEVNATYAQERGYLPEELQGQPIMTIFAPEVRDDVRDHFNRIDQAGHGVFESVHLRKDGSRFPVLMEVTAIRDNQQRAATRVCYSLDISERKQAEQALAEEAVRRRILIGQSRDGIVVIGPDGRVHEANRRFGEMLGYSDEEMQQLCVWDWDTQWSREQLLEMIRDVDAHGDHFETRHQRKDGTLIDVEISTNGAVIGEQKLVFCVVRDISQRKTAELALKKLQVLLNETERLAGLGGWEYDTATQRVTWTDEVYRIHGLTKDYDPDDPQMNMQFYAPEDRAKIDAAFKRALERGGSYDLELQLITPQGDQKWVRTIGRTERQAGVVARVFGNIMDITERKQADAERERLSAAIKQAGESIVITDPDGIIEYVNPAFETATGYESRDVIGQNPRLIQSGEHDQRFYENMWDTIQSGKTWSGRIINQRKNGTLYTEATTISPVRDDRGRIVNYVSVKRDISEQLRLERQFHQAQKMESVGRLAGGVAHDYNNILSVILGYTELALEGVDPADRLHADLREILKAAERSRDITRQLLAFARKQTIAPEILDLNTTVEGMFKMLRHLIGEDIDLTWRPDSGILPIRIDPAQIDQILANLCVNARDAIAGVGNLIIGTEAIRLDKNFCQDHPGCVSGDYVMLSVSDSGSGMDNETLEKIFEPFFTTKELGKGTGLGLATVYGIVKQNDGFIDVTSHPGEGTTFRIYFPRHEGPSTGDREAEESADHNRGRGETVLLVEDDEAILKMARFMLERLGYVVLTAKTPGDALHIAENHNTRIDLLLSDVVMPEMNGRELAARMQSFCPHLECLFMSGYTADVIARSGVLEKNVNFIHKPFSKKELGAVVRRVLDRPPGR